MSKFVLGSSMVWVVLCLIMGMVLVSLPSGSEGSRFEQRFIGKRSFVEPVSQEQGENTATTQVRIEGTPQESNNAKTSVKVK